MDERTDILISKVVDGAANAGDWTDLERAASERPAVWRELALAQRDQALLVLAVGREVSCAERVDAPQPSTASPAHRLRRFGVWGGWAVAATLALAYVTPGVGGRGSAGMNQAGLVPDLGVLKDKLSADQAWEVYEAAGKREQRVLGELPERLLVDATPAPDGHGVQVIFIRQIKERVTLPQLLKESCDEMGRPTAAPVQVRTLLPLISPEARPQRAPGAPAVMRWPLERTDHWGWPAPRATGLLEVFS